MARKKFDAGKENGTVTEEDWKYSILKQYVYNEMHGIIDKDLIEERNKIVHSSNPVISAYISPELFTIIDSLRGNMSRSEFCRMAISEYCSALQEMESNSSNSKNSRNVRTQQ